MTEAEKNEAFDLLAQLTPQRFDEQYRPEVERTQVVEDLLKDALQTKDADVAELACILGFRTGFTREQIPLLISLLTSDWHVMHENLVREIEVFETAEAIEAFYWASQVRLQYLDYDDSSALARKAIYALARIPTPEAQAKLESIAQDPDEDRRNWAIKRLEKRRKEGSE